MGNGKQLEGPRGVQVEVESENGYGESVSTLPSEDVPQKKSVSEKSKPPSPKPYMPPLPFPQRFTKAKLDSQFGKCLYVLKKLHVNIPFIDALSQMPMYAKFSKKNPL